MVLLFGIILTALGFYLDAVGKDRAAREQIEEKRHQDLINQLDFQNRLQMAGLEAEYEIARKRESRNTMTESKPGRKRSISRKRTEETPDGYIRSEELKYEEDM